MLIRLASLIPGKMLSVDLGRVQAASSLSLMEQVKQLGRNLPYAGSGLRLWGPAGSSCTHYELNADRSRKTDLLMKRTTCLFSLMLLWLKERCLGAEGSSCCAGHVVPWSP